MNNKRLVLSTIAVPALFLLLVLFYNIPPVHSRLAWRVDEVRTRVKYALNPPDEAVFIPQEAAPTSDLPTPAPLWTNTVTATPTTLGPTETPAPSPTPTTTPTPLPDQVILSGVKYEHQHQRWNYCGPANLSMALTFWGWDGDRDVVGEYVKPEDKDKNVMPYEMQDFVETQTEGLSALVRSGGEIELLKRMIAAGFPVVVEKGYYEYDYTGKLGWMGHYQFVTGYDETKQVFVLQDTYIEDGENHQVSYADFIEGWRSFNYLFLVVYPQDRAGEVLDLLGPWADPNWAYSHALEIANAEAQALTGIDQFFAWFNVGTSQANLMSYAEAGRSFDQAFSLYASLPDDSARPYRIMWYQTWPYWAYFYSGRYQDVINLADTTLNDTISEPVLEESFYWRALAREALGDLPGAIADFRESVRLNPNFSPGWEQLSRLGQGGG
ncbi:MAG TPA: C39 family peptidase [Anaerolineales bacterium]